MVCLLDCLVFAVTDSGEDSNQVVVVRGRSEFYDGLSGFRCQLAVDFLQREPD